MIQITATAVRAFGLLFIGLILAPVSQAKEWRGITPLHSNRADVERLLGPPRQGSQNSYSTANEQVNVVYGEGSCPYGWNVPSGTVISLTIVPRNPIQTGSLGLEAREFDKRRDVHIETLYFYVNEKDGLNYTVDVSKGVATSVEYYPSAADASLRCGAPKPQAAVAGGTGPDKAAVTLSTAERVRAMERLAQTYEYTCAMHPDVHQSQEGRCPKCGMVLLQLKPAFSGEYLFSFSTVPAVPASGAKTRLRFSVQDPQTGAAVKKYVLNHERLFHLFIVSNDLTIYQHVHPVLKQDGSFEFDVRLPLSGRYKLHGDFFPVGGTLQTFHREILAAGDPGASIPTTFAITPDATSVKTVDGLTARLEFGRTGVPTTGVLIPLKYSLTDARTGEPVKDLEPYLGAWGHTLILSEDQAEYLHSHPTVMVPDGPRRKNLHGGPEIEFQTMFPVPGNYRIWTQFQRAGRVITIPFTVRVAN